MIIDCTKWGMSGEAILRIGKTECEVDVCSVTAEDRDAALIDAAELGGYRLRYSEALDYAPQRITIEGFFRGYVDKTDSSIPKIEKVIFNPPATIVLWGDGTKTVVKANGRCGHTVVATSYSDNGEAKTEEIEIGELYDPEKGLAMCIAKKALGNKGNYYNEFKKWLDNDGDDKNTD